MRRPTLLLLDEVNAGLNASEIDDALKLIEQISGRSVTILIIEHLMKVVLSVSERLLVLHHGELIADGTPKQVVEDQRVIEALFAGFSGIANVKKVLDELKDTPNQLAGRAPSLTSTLSSTEMKLKKDVLGLKRKLMDIAQKKDEL